MSAPITPLPTGAPSDYVAPVDLPVRRLSAPVRDKAECLNDTLRYSLERIKFERTRILNARDSITQRERRDDRELRALWHRLDCLYAGLDNAISDAGGEQP